jgi:uncharacterized protein YbjT (DUF2867 family)
VERVPEKEKNMFAVTGVTGKVGGEVALNLLKAGQRVRAVVRNTQKGEEWAKRGAEIAVADINDASALASSFQGADGVFVVVPPNFDPKDGFPEAHAIAKSLHDALESARPGKLVYLSTIGAEAAQTNLLTQHSIIEDSLRRLAMPTTFLRPGWFMENASFDVASAMDEGVVRSFLQPVDKQVPMVATADVGRLASKLLQEKWTGHRIVELEGPHRVTPMEIALSFAKLLGHAVSAEAVPRETWQSVFTAQGMNNPTPRMKMLDGFNEGWIEFSNGESGSLKGEVPIDPLMKALIEQRASNHSTHIAEQR